MKKTAFLALTAVGVMALFLVGDAVPQGATKPGDPAGVPVRPNPPAANPQPFDTPPAEAAQPASDPPKARKAKVRRAVVNGVLLQEQVEVFFEGVPQRKGVVFVIQRHNRDMQKERIADEKLQLVRKLLRRIAADYPGSSAANHAGQMLRVGIDVGAAGRVRPDQLIQQKVLPMPRLPFGRFGEEAEELGEDLPRERRADGNPKPPSQRQK